MDWRTKLLNLKTEDYQKDYKEDIYKIVFEERQELQLISQENKNLSGLCEVIANQIKERLENIGIKYYQVEELHRINVDHVFLICEYQYQNKMIRYLIDPTFTQFIKEDNKILIKFKEWPSEKIDKNILEQLKTNGLVELNNYVLNNYLNAFSEEEYNLDLDEYLLSIRTNKISRR